MLTSEVRRSLIKDELTNLLEKWPDKISFKRFKKANVLTNIMRLLLFYFFVSRQLSEQAKVKL